MAKLVVFGASGATGRPIVEQAVAAGHEVTAFVRDPATAPPGARVVSGDVLDAAAVDAAVAGHNVIVSALGHRRTAARNPWSRDTSPPDLFARSDIGRVRRDEALKRVPDFLRADRQLRHRGHQSVLVCVSGISSYFKRWRASARRPATEPSITSSPTWTTRPPTTPGSTST